MLYNNISFGRGTDWFVISKLGYNKNKYTHNQIYLEIENTYLLVTSIDRVKIYSRLT